MKNPKWWMNQITMPILRFSLSEENVRKLTLQERIFYDNCLYLKQKNLEINAFNLMKYGDKEACVFYMSMANSVDDHKFTS